MGQVHSRGSSFGRRRSRALRRAIEQARDFFASLAPAEVVMPEELLRERRDDAGDE